ncbi:MAG: hypothetical protein J2O48_10730 [Solirubrobacterales bacterium]|nr:hypothetical protein [Solirubrobacterales bacterium]
MSKRNVLGVLDGNEAHVARVVEAAVELADDEHARLTLVQSWYPGQAYAWFSPCGAGGMYVPPLEDPKLLADRALARAAESVPRSIPVTTIVLAPDCRRQLCRLARSGTFDALVADERLFRHGRRLLRELRRDGVEPVPVSIRKGRLLPKRQPQGAPRESAHRLRTA